jgi:hypothetical protein
VKVDLEIGHCGKCYSLLTFKTGFGFGFSQKLLEDTTFVHFQLQADICNETCFKISNWSKRQV